MKQRVMTRMLESMGRLKAMIRMATATSKSLRAKQSTEPEYGEGL